MRGKATISLYDKNKKLIYKKVEYNKVTNGVNNLFNPSYVVGAIKQHDYDIANTYLPLWQNFCGLMLFTKQIDEDVIIPTKDVFSNYTGSATDASHYDDTNIYRGQFISSESTIEPEKISLVFSFGLEKVSGNIGSIALTSQIGGNNGLGMNSSESIGNYESLFYSYTDKSLAKTGTCGVGDDASNNYIPYCNSSVDGTIVGINTNGDMVCLQKVDDTQLKIKLYSIKKKANFTDTFYKIESKADFESIYGGTLDNVPMLSKISEETITLANGFDILKSSVIGDYLYMSNISGGTCYCYKINLKTMEIFYQNTNIDIDDIYDYKNTEDRLYITSSQYLYIVSLNQYRENQYLFESTFDKIEVAENNLTPLVFKDTLALLNTKNIVSGDIRTIYFLTNSNIFNQNKLVFGNACDNIINFCFNFNEPCFGILTNVGDYAYINVNVFTSFLSTINNLSNVVTKYSTQELRIVYELMTEDYKEE